MKYKYLIIVSSFCAALPDVIIDKDFQGSEICVLKNDVYVINKDCKLSGKIDKIAFTKDITIEFSDFECINFSILDPVQQTDSDSPKRLIGSILRPSPRGFNSSGIFAFSHQPLKFFKVYAYGSVIFSDNDASSAFNSFVVPENKELNVVESFKLFSNSMVFDDNFDVQKLMYFKLTTTNGKMIYEALKKSSYKDFADELMYGICFAKNGGTLDKVLEEGKKEDLPDNLEKEKFEEKIKLFDASKDNSFIRGLLLLKYNSASDDYTKVMEKYIAIMKGVEVSVGLNFDDEQPRESDSTPEKIQVSKQSTAPKAKFTTSTQKKQSDVGGSSYSSSSKATEVKPSFAQRFFINPLKYLCSMLISPLTWIYPIFKSK